MTGDPGRPPEEAPASGSAADGSFYSWLWRRLPGTWPLRVALLVLAAAVVVVVLFLVVFPWLEPRLPFNQVTVDQGAGLHRVGPVTGG